MDNALISIKEERNALIDSEADEDNGQMLPGRVDANWRRDASLSHSGSTRARLRGG